MGLYIEDQKDLTKEKWLQVHGFHVLKGLTGEFSFIRSKKLYPVALINNGIFYAAGVGFNEAEWNRFKADTSGRPIKYYLVPEDKIYEVVGKDNPYFKH